MFVRLLDDGAVYVRDLHYATEFPSKKEATAWAKRNLAEPSQYKFLCGKKLETFRKDFQKWLEEGMPVVEIALVDHEHNDLYDPEKHTKEDVLDWLWWYTTEADDRGVPYETYGSWSVAKWDHKPSIFRDFKSYHNQEYTEQYFGLEIHFPKDYSFEAFRDELNYLLDRYELTHTVEVSNYDGGEHTGVGIGLFTDDCSASGIPYLVMVDREKDLWMVAKLRWGSMREECSPRSLEDCFTFMTRNGFTYNQ